MAVVVSVVVSVVVTGGRVSVFDPCVNNGHFMIIRSVSYLRNPGSLLRRLS